jgi:hypothetical protein
MNVIDEKFTADGHFYTVKTKQCIHCGDTGILDVEAQGLFYYNQGELIQNCFPSMSKGLREQLITGIHPQCFEDMVAEWEEE